MIIPAKYGFFFAALFILVAFMISPWLVLPLGFAGFVIGGIIGFWLDRQAEKRELAERGEYLSIHGAPGHPDTLKPPLKPPSVPRDGSR